MGKTVQVVPHVCNAIQDWVEHIADKQYDEPCDDQKPEICVIELGGTIGDIESMPFVEAMRQFQFRVGRENFCNLHLSLVPVLGSVGEQKTKPTQQAVRELRALGLSPDLILCRSEQPLTEQTKQKISLFCHVPPENVVGVHNVKNIYNVPLLLASQNVHTLILQRLSISNYKMETCEDGNIPVQMKPWKQMTEKFDRMSEMKNPIRIALVGKYTELSDAYLSIIKALTHASMLVEHKVVIDWIKASEVEERFKTINPQRYEECWNVLKQANGILVPGGFGDRGIEGKIAVARFARMNKVPYLGICLGFQIAAIEIARNVLEMAHATSEEIGKDGDKEDDFIVVSMPEISTTQLGGTMRLGARETIIVDQKSQLAKLYGNPDKIHERHRHRYEINPNMVDRLQSAGLKFVGKDTTGQRMIMSELQDHPFFVGVQFHPEFLSRPTRPSPPFVGLVRAALSNKLSNPTHSIINGIQ